MSSWFYVSFAQYILIALLIQALARREWPSDRWQAFGAWFALFLWPIVFAYVIGEALWLASRKLLSNNQSEKR